MSADSDADGKRIAKGARTDEAGTGRWPIMSDGAHRGRGIGSPVKNADLLIRYAVFADQRARSSRTRDRSRHVGHRTDTENRGETIGEADDHRESLTGVLAHRRRAEDRVHSSRSHIDQALSCRRGR
jgi:hypothetical protein